MSPKLTRTLLGVAAFAAATACVVNLSFDYNKAGVQVQFSNSQMDQTIALDLSTQPEVQQHKANVQDISLDWAEATVAAVGSTNNVTQINGNMKLRADGAPSDGSKDVLVGALTNVPVTVGSKVRLNGTPALDALVLSTIKGSGKVTAIIKGSATGGSTGDFTLDVKLHLSMAYEP